MNTATRGPSLILAPLLLTVATSCSSTSPSSHATPPPTTRSISVVLSDFAIAPQPQEAKSGSFVFQVNNQGKVTHEFNIYHSALPIAGLPIDQASHQVDENSPQVQSTQLSVPIGPASTTEVTAKLAPGTYYFICNQPGHYSLGMRVAFTVH